VSKLSELVAVRVMGWELVTEFPRMSRSDGRTLFFEGRQYKVEDDDGQVSRSFRPDTSIADAWRVVEKMRADGWRFALEDNKSYSHMAEFWKNPEDPDYKETDGWQDWQKHGQEPLAICLAALRACGVPEREIEEARKQ